MSDEVKKPHVITHVGILDAQVCSTGTWDEALAFLCQESPAGTANNWQRHRGGEAFAPVQCESYPERTHYMFNC